jgi:hypothetical protein
LVFFSRTLSLHKEQNLPCPSTRTSLSLSGKHSQNALLEPWVIESGFVPVTRRTGVWVMREVCSDRVRSDPARSAR